MTDQHDLERLVQACHFSVLDIDMAKVGEIDERRLSYLETARDRLVEALGYDPAEVKYRAAALESAAT